MCNSLTAQVLPESDHSVRRESNEEALQPDKSKRSTGTQQGADVLVFSSARSFCHLDKTEPTTNGPHHARLVIFGLKLFVYDMFVSG